MIKIENVSFKYGNSEEGALKNINLNINDGEVVVLLGGSGCGKTTVTRLINRLVPEFYNGELEGKVFINNKDTSDYQVQDLTGTVGSVFQDPRSQFFATDTTAEIAFSCENMGLPKDEIRERIVKTTNDLQISHLIERSIFELSSGEKQIIAIGSVYALAPKYIVLDEPSANLDGMATKHLRNVLTTLKSKGYTIVISEHRIHYLKDIVDKAYIFKNGEIVKELNKDDFNSLTNEQANSLGLRSIDLNNIHVNDCLLEQVPSKDYTSTPQIKFSNVNFYYTKTRPVLQNLNFSASAGNIVGVIGHNGVGKSTLLEIICGLRKEKSGDIYIKGKKSKSKDRIKKTYIVMQDSDYQLFSESVEKELYLEDPKNKDLKQKGSIILEKLGLSNFLESHPAALSGGQKQRLCIAVASLKDSDVICFDEPTSGLDYNNMKIVSALLKDMAKSGKTLFVTTHDYEFLMEACSHICYLDEGTVKEYFPVNETSAGKILNILEGN